MDSLGAGLLLVVLSAFYSNALGKYYVTLNSDILAGNKAYLNCSSNFPANYPRWQINDRLHYFPLNNGMTIELDASVIVCCFVKTYLNGSVVDIYSNPVTLQKTGARVKRGFLSCQEENITFFNKMNMSTVFVSIHQDGRDCQLSFNISRCIEPETQTEGHPTSPFETNARIDIGLMGMFYGHNVIVTMNDDCDNCREIFYLPDMKPTENRFIEKNYTGPIIDDLSNEYGCDFGGAIINYILCIHTGAGSNQCFESPCGNGQVYTSFCNSTTAMERVSLDVHRPDSGTVVSVFCAAPDCRGQVSYVMIFNVAINLLCENCDDNSECVDGDCVCRNNYTGNGTVCQEITYEAVCERCSENGLCQDGQCKCQPEYTGDGIVCTKSQDISLLTPYHTLTLLPHSTLHAMRTSVGKDFVQDRSATEQKSILVGVSLGAVALLIVLVLLAVSVSCWIYYHKGKGALSKRKRHVYEDVTGDFNTTNAHPIVHSNPAYETTQIVGVMENPAYITTHRHSPFSTE